MVAATSALVAAVGAALSGGSAGAAGPEQSATSALSAAKAPIAQLHQTRVVNFKGVAITSYQQTVGGVPVLNGQVSVIDAPGATPTVVGDGTSQIPATAKAASSSAKPISAARAIAIARSSTGARGLRARPTASLAVDPKHGALVRRVVLASSHPMKDFEVLVDATSGAVLSTRNLLQNATGSAKVFTPNPVVWNNGYSGIGTTKSADHNDQDTAKLTSLRQHVNLFDLKSGQHCLLGTYVEARVGKGNKGKSVCKSSLNWNSVTRSNDKFEALEAYSQIDQVAAYYKNGLGFTGTANVHPKMQKIIADNFPDDNSFYSPSDRKIRYGTGGVDDAEDGDVVVHEYGHSIQDAQDPGFGSNDKAGALGEGFGDYQSALNTALTPNLAPLTVNQETCIFDWDGTAGYGGPGVKPCGRLATGTDGTNTYTQALSTCNLGGGHEEVHCLGEVWAHGLIDLLNSVPFISGNPPIATDVLLSQFGYADNETFPQAVDGLVAADNAIFSGANVAAICTEMETNRGINASSCP